VVTQPLVAMAQSTSVASHPKTPWGDPDLQGHYTNKYEYGTPFERPASFPAGTRPDQFSASELADLVKKRQQEALDRAPFFGGDPEGKIGNSAEFRDIYEVTKGSRAWLVTDPPDGKIPPILPDARARVQDAVRSGSFGAGPFNGPEDFSLWERCITRGLPGSMLPGVYGNSYQIVQAPGYVVIRYEMVHETRVIPIDPRPALGKSLRFDVGSARGHWEGDTLVVDVTNFSPKSDYRGSGETLHLVERFTRTPNGLRYEVSVDDPQTWTGRWTAALDMAAQPEAMFEYACHEGNNSMRNILSGARAAEK
jgi:hypothetical protein